MTRFSNRRYTQRYHKFSRLYRKKQSFEFNSKSLQKISGTANGTVIVLLYTCIFIENMETQFPKKNPIEPCVWKRFIQDLFLIWNGREENLEKFSWELDGFNPNIRFTCEESKEKVNFLDAVVKIKNERLSADLNSKPADSHQYFHYDFCLTRLLKKTYFFQSNFENNENLLRKKRSQVLCIMVYYKKLSSTNSQRVSGQDTFFKTLFQQKQKKMVFH